jgi:hypothetical protein
MTTEAKYKACGVCNRGAETCQWCENVTEEDFNAICDCGLLDFGHHLNDCELRMNFKYVIVADHAAAELLKPA